MWLWYLEFNTGLTLIWVRLISSWKKFTKLKNLQVIKFFCFSDSQKKNGYRNWVKTSQSLKKFCNFPKIMSDKVFYCSDSQKKNGCRNWVKTSQSLKKFCNSPKITSDKVFYCSDSQNKNGCRGCEKSRCENLEVLCQNTPLPDTGKNVLIVQPYLVKFYFLGWRSSMATLSRSSMLTFVVSRTRSGDYLF